MRRSHGACLAGEADGQQGNIVMAAISSLWRDLCFLTQEPGLTIGQAHRVPAYNRLRKRGTLHEWRLLETEEPPRQEIVNS